VTARVLVIDDEPTIRRTLERALRAMDLDVLLAADAQAAYDLLHGAEVDVILLDLHLPQMSGDTFFVAATRKWPYLGSRIVLMTGDLYAEQAHWPNDLRGCRMLHKPFMLDLLRATVREVLADISSRQARAENER
jgi:DNA-binding response OmpR family regulator